MRLHQLKNVDGAVHRRKRVGTGEGGGHGKTSGRGGKGQTARTGGGIRIGFEGGQMPIYRRLPMRGFKSLFKVHAAPVNLADLEKLAQAGGATEITREVLEAGGLLDPREETYKILGTGDINRALTVHAPKFSETAKAKIEKAGGKAVVTEAAPKAAPTT